MSTPSKRKRTVTLVSGGEVDLNSPIPVSPEIVEAMRLRILELEDELSAQQPPAKRARTSAAASSQPVASASATPAGPTAASIKAEEKKRKAQLKKVFDRLKKECKSENVKFQGSPKTIKFDEIFEKPEFDALFEGKGVLIQPTPENKPKSAVTIIKFVNEAQIAEFFGGDLKPLKGTHWSRGGIPGRGLGGWGSGGFSKSIKQGSVDIHIQDMEVNYSKNNMKCTLKFDVQMAGGGMGDWDEDDY